MEIFGERFDLLGTIGHGRLGPIFEACSRSDSGVELLQRVAVQVLPDGLNSNLEFIDWLQRGVTSLQADAAPEAPQSASITASAPGFSFAESSIVVSESGVAAYIQVLRSGDLSAPAEITWWTEDLGAVADDDYADAGLNTERFDALVESVTFCIPLINDGVPEGARPLRFIWGLRPRRAGSASPRVPCGWRLLTMTEGLGVALFQVRRRVPAGALSLEAIPGR